MSGRGTQASLSAKRDSTIPKEKPPRRACPYSIDNGKGKRCILGKSEMEHVLF